jgi:thiol-disulfide isomerase/thioredoxin
VALESLPETDLPPKSGRPGDSGEGRATLRRRRATIAGLAVLLVLGTGFVAYAVSVSQAVPTPKYANLVLYSSPAKVPAFDLASLEGTGHLSSVLLRGGPAVVNWFQSTCVACQAELGTFAAVANSKRAEIRFLGVDINDPSTAAALAMVRRARADYPVAVAPGVASISLATRFGVGDLPATVFVSAQGRILGEVLGKVPRAELVTLLDNLAAGRPLDS